jgi:hypothetical protein
MFEIGQLGSFVAKYAMTATITTIVVVVVATIAITVTKPTQ